MKETLHILSCAAVAIVALASCAKEQFKENTIPAGEKIQVSINGQIGDFVSADATKADAASVIRVTWTGDDLVYVYDGTDVSIGTLTVTPDPKNASQALLSGEITSTASPAPTKLTLVYVKGAESAPDIEEGKISIDFSSQYEEDVPFVLYSTIDYNTDALSKTNEYILFKFATSVMTVNCTGLSTNAGSKIGISKAEIEGVSTVCELAVTGSGVTVSGAKTGTVTRIETEEPSVFTQSDSRASFKLALAADPADPAERNILVHQGSKVSGALFTSAKLDGGKSYNTVYQLGGYISDGAGGYYPIVTGVMLNKNTATIEKNTMEELVAIVTPTNATNKQVDWSSDNMEVATVDENGKVTGVAEGSAVITATTADGNFTAVCSVKVIPSAPQGFVYLGTVVNGKAVYWAEKNLGADNPENYGKYFQWAATSGHVCNGTNNGDTFENEFNFAQSTAPYSTPGQFSSVEWNKYVPSDKEEYWSGTGSPDNKVVLDKEDDAAYVENNTWRMPTNNDFLELVKQCYTEWGTYKDVNGLIVYKAKSGDAGYAYFSSMKQYGDNNGWNDVTDKAKPSYSTDTDTFVFFPAAGYGNGNSLNLAGSYGNYWSSSLQSYSHGYILSFYSSGAFPQSGGGRWFGYPVRPVLELD